MNLFSIKRWYTCLLTSWTKQYAKSWPISELDQNLGFVKNPFQQNFIWAFHRVSPQFFFKSLILLSYSFFSAHYLIVLSYKWSTQSVELQYSGLFSNFLLGWNLKSNICNILPMQSIWYQIFSMLYIIISVILSNSVFFCQIPSGVKKGTLKIQKSQIAILVLNLSLISAVFQIVRFAGDQKNRTNRGIPVFVCAQIRNQDFMNYNRFFFSWKPLLFFQVLIKSKSHAC